MGVTAMHSSNTYFYLDFLHWAIVNSCQNIYGKDRVKVRSTALPLRYKNRPVKITICLGLDNIIRLKFPTNFDRCTIYTY